MPNPIKSAVCGDGYTAACRIEDVFKSNGGSFDIEGAGALYQLQYGTRGDTHWTEEAEARTGAGFILPGTTGIQFRNAVAGQNATVSAVIAPPAQPFAQIFASSSAATAPGTSLTGIIASNGTTTAGAGFTSARTGAGVYVITFTTPFAAPPVVVPCAFITAGTERLIDLAAAPTAAGFTVHTLNAAGAPTDADWNFIVTAVV